ncbi:VOC family protein [Chondromyces apiculatus]|uniref:Putative lyase n=1 Tax=Chondromyces apiculatus DSM 436 TaxID=1192034 RepID=A0A017THU4_9BACT|nr:VOC family protein [Chondromyces apiculatus]EYF08824.1 putative lyase [Chondromyces apiculatus DSM 436]
MAELLINIDVDDLPRAVAFYTRAFGLTVGRRFGDAGVELLGAASPLYLLAKAAGTQPVPAPRGAGDGGAAGARDYHRHWTPVHLDVAVADLEAAVKQAEDAGAVLEAPLSTSGWGRMACMADPFGHGFCLLQFHGQGYDAITTGRG